MDSNNYNSFSLNRLLLALKNENSNNSIDFPLITSPFFYFASKIEMNSLSGNG
jgi:hypothetical protein